MEELIKKLEKNTVCFFALKNGKCLDVNGNEVTTEMLVKYHHVITNEYSYIILSWLSNT